MHNFSSKNDNANACAKLTIGELLFIFAVNHVRVVWEYKDRNINIFSKVSYKKVKFIALPQIYA